MICLKLATRTGSFQVEVDATPADCGVANINYERKPLAVPGTWNTGTNYADSRYQLPRIDTTDVSAHALNQVFNLLVGREHASTVIASQHEPDYWYDVFSEAALADAVMSRLANHGSKLTLTGEDMRTRDDIKQERMAPTTPTRLRQPRKP